jgi:hypothetical protein
MRRALDAVEASESVLLDATPAGKKVYDLLGFKDAWMLDRCVRPGRAMPKNGGGRAERAGRSVRRMTSADIDTVAAMDARTIGVKRVGLLGELFSECPQYAFVCERGQGELEGCVLGREGELYEQFGPIIAPDAEMAEALLRSALSAAGDRAAVLDVPRAAAWGSLLEELGFEPRRPFIRMVRGSLPDAPALGELFAIAGPEFG